MKDLRLVDYKVRILNTGTEAVTRLSIESTDSKGKNWFTIGVSTNIIDASFKALIDSLDYKLFKDDAPASCLLYTSPSPRDFEASRMPSSA